MKHSGVALVAILALTVFLASCVPGTGALNGGDNSFPGVVVAGHEVAREAVLRAIPSTYIDAARTGLHIAYEHTSHGTHVACGLFGLQDYKAGDEALFGVTNYADPPDPTKLDFHDGGIPGGAVDLSTADANWSSWVDQNRAFLDDPANADINVIMWSWCSIGGHDVQAYLDSMQTLINEYGTGGSKIGTSAGMRATAVTFIFFTGHAEADSNVGEGRPKDQADLIIAYCQAHGYLCLDYYSIDSHDMDGTYYEDASDDAVSGNLAYNQAWQDSHTLGTDWFYNRGSPGGSEDYGAHLTQHITSNRKAYAMWFILARIAGWDGSAN